MFTDPPAPSVLLSAGIGTWTWNPACNQFALSPEAIALLQADGVEQPLDEVLASIHNEDAADFLDALQTMAEEPGIHHAEFRASRDDGELRWYRAVGVSERAEDGTLSAHGLLLDNTELRRAEETHRSFFAQPNGLHLIANTDGTVVDANDGWQLLLGYRREELIGRNFLDLVLEEDHEATIEEIANLKRGITMMHFENRFQHRDGAYRVISWSAAVPEGSELVYGVGKDVTQERAAQDQLKEAATVFNNSGEGIIITDSDGFIRNVNGAFTRITGYSKSEVLGQHTRLLNSGRHDEHFYKAMWDTIQREGLWRGEIWNRRKSGETYPELLTITRIEGDDHRYIGMFTDISKLKRTEEQLQQLAHYDQLTGLPNRYLINERLAQSLRRAQRRKIKLAVVFLDIDSFKNINDSLGHQAGDRLLVITARRLLESLREEDNIGRIGGDEFLIVMEDIDSPGDVTTVAEKIISTLRQPIELNGQELSVSASLGISIYPDDGKTTQLLMSNADAAMYSAKEQGRDTFRFYSERLTRDAFRHVLLDSALREAEARNELRLAYQPQLDISTGKIEGVEALLRWHHPQLGTVPPAQFIPHAERTGLIRSIGRWVLREACNQAVAWNRDGCGVSVVAVNISAPQFRDAGFVDTVRSVLEETGLPAEQLELEITESVLLKDTEELIEHMQSLRELGVRFAIDDFGTGYSSLSYLRRMPIDRLKVDRSFVEHLESDSNSHIIAGAIVAFGQAMGIEVVAEGIETMEQERAVLAMGCKIGQGFRYGMPVYSGNIEAMIRRKNGAATER